MSEIWANQITQSFHQVSLPSANNDCKVKEKHGNDSTPTVQSLPCSDQSGACIVASDFVDGLKSKYFDLKNR